MTWRDSFTPGTVVSGPAYVHPSVTVAGILFNGDDSDGTLLVAHPKTNAEQDPKHDAWDMNWIRTTGAQSIEGSQAAQEIRDAFPLPIARPDHIFMVIRPKRQIETYANLDALLAGMAGEGVATAERDQQVREAAALAIADPGTDIKIPPGASNSPWLRFTQVEGA